MKQTEQYVRQATRGLWGKARRELKTELEGHIAERCQEFRLAGLSAAEAERQTLRELGAPAQVSGGMLDVHTFPALGKAGVLSALLATAIFSALPQGLAQVQSIYSRSENYGASSYLDFQQLKEAVQKAGGELSGPADSATVTIPGAPRPSYPLNTAQAPSATLTQDGKTYLNLGTFLGGLFNTGADINVGGWNNPTIQAGQARITLETQDWRVLNDLYMRLIRSSGPQLNAGAILSRLEPIGDTGEVAFTGTFAPDGVYALIMPVFGEWFSQTAGGEQLDSGSIVLKTNINQAKAGQLDFRIDNGVQNFKLASSVDEFQLALDPYRDTTKLRQWDAQHPAPVLLLKLSGKFGPDAYTVVSPASVKKQP
ncbi:permease prefix domain 1-containing protein [Deinococcus sp. AJ005]|uniref:permease prefix domain 1-containing protein n=1 Tax=Deinococcus sp. AJ005 TaxID=2652443 RepID=UPI00125CB608|nr:permease prefix domain 1-containing protein [Deinococcus sp. AJ005]QFP78525.1 hypothetical protein DAAJ005_18295 [Deinococcus sp. AJ005]